MAGFIQQAIEAAPGQPILIDKFMEDAFEIDVDAVMQHIEEAGVHSGDAACVLPPYKVSAYHQGIMQEYTKSQIAAGLVTEDEIAIIEQR